MKAKWWTSMASIAVFVLFFCLPVHGDSLDKLVADLKSPDEAVRVRAAYQLGQLRDPVTVDPLIAALTDPSRKVRSATIGALANLKSEVSLHAVKSFLVESQKNAPSLQAGFDAIDRISDRDTVVGLARDPQLERLSGRVAERLLHLEGIRLPPPHMGFAGAIRLLLLDPVVVKDLGDLKLSYEVSEARHRYSDTSQGAAGVTGVIILERVRINVGDSRGMLLSHREWQSTYEPKPTETFMVTPFHGVSNFTADKRYTAYIDIVLVLQDVLGVMSKDSLKELAQQGLSTRARTLATEMLQSKQ